MLALALSRRIYDLGAICTPDENSFGAWQFYIRMIGVSGSDILLLYEVEKADFQAHLDAAAARFHARGPEETQLRVVRRAAGPALRGIGGTDGF